MENRSRFSNGRSDLKYERISTTRSSLTIKSRKPKAHLFIEKRKKGERGVSKKEIIHLTKGDPMRRSATPEKKLLFANKVQKSFRRERASTGKKGSHNNGKGKKNLQGEKEDLLQRDQQKPCITHSPGERTTFFKGIILERFFL